MEFYIWTIVFLGICTITDLKEGYVYRNVCITNLVAVIVIKLLQNPNSIYSLLGGVLIGLVLYAVSVFTREKIGKGDAWVIINVGALLGAKDTITILVWSLAIGCLFGAGGVALKKLKMNDSIVFLPFILAGALISHAIK